MNKGGLGFERVELKTQAVSDFPAYSALFL